MYSMHDLLQLLNSDGGDELRLFVGAPPVLVLDGAEQTLENPPLDHHRLEEYLQEIASSRQRRELRQRGLVQFLYRFPETTSFIVRVQLHGSELSIRVF